MATAFDTMISAATVPVEETGKKRKSDVPVIRLDDETSVALSTFLEKKKAKKSAETEMAVVEGDLMKYLQAKADELMLKGKMLGTMEVVSNDGANTVKFIMSDKFSVGDINSARSILGDAVVDEIVEKKINITMRPEVFEDDKLQKALAAKLGADFAKFFVVEQTYKAKTGLKENIYRIANGSKDLLNKIRTFVVPVKPSIK